MKTNPSRFFIERCIMARKPSPKGEAEPKTTKAAARKAATKTHATRQRKMNNGRKHSLLDLPKIRRLLKSLEMGNPVTVACNVAGISADSYSSWRRCGIAVRDGLPLPDSAPADPAIRELTVDFLADTDRARDVGAEYMASRFRSGAEPTERISRTRKQVTETKLDRDGNPYEATRVEEQETITIDPGDWRAAMEFLARTRPEEWGRREHISLTGEDNGPVEVNHVIDNFAALFQSVRQAQQKPDDEGTD